MSTPDRAFFAAYSSDTPYVISGNHAYSAPPHPSSAPAKASQRPPAQRKQAPAAAPAEAARHRLDARHVPASSPPHQAVAAATARKELLQTQSFEVGCFTRDWDPQSSCVVVSPSVLPEQRPAPASSPRSEPVDATLDDREEAGAVEEPSRPPAEAGRTAKKSGGSSLPPSPPPLRSDHWKPVWELDEFVWPDEAGHIFATQTDYFRYAGDKLLDASREGLKILAVVATREKEGGTTLVTCLARAVAAAGAKVALFDGNLLNPELGPKLGLDFSRGWQDSLDAPETLDETAVYSLRDGVTLFPLSVPHGVASLSDERVSAIFRQASDHFDLVIVDAGTLPPGGECLFEAGENCPISAVMIVRDVRRTTETETLVTASRLKALGVDAIGIAENFCHPDMTRAAAA